MTSFRMSFHCFILVANDSGGDKTDRRCTKGNGDEPAEIGLDPILPEDRIAFNLGLDRQAKFVRGVGQDI